MYKESIYNIIKKYNDKTFLYNSLSNGLVEIKSDKDLQKILHDFAHINMAKNDDIEQYKELGFIVHKEIEERKIVEYSYQKSKFSNKLQLELFPSYLCNLKCEFCTLKSLWYSESKISNLKVYQYFDQIRKFIINQDYEDVDLTFYGGEPLIFLTQIFDFLDSLKSFNIKASLITNGTLLDKDKIVEISKRNEIKSIQFTIDGLPGYHDEVKGVPDSFEKTITNINDLVASNYRVIVSIRINVSRKNKNTLRELLELLSLKINKNKRVRYYLGFINSNTGVVDDEYCLGKDDVLVVKELFIELSREFGLNYNRIIMTSLLDNCSYLKANAYSITPDLKLFKCFDDQVESKLSVGFLKDGYIQTSYDNEEKVTHQNSISSSLLSNKKCYDCEWLPVCRGGCPLTLKSDKCKDNMNLKFESYVRTNFG